MTQLIGWMLTPLSVRDQLVDRNALADAGALLERRGIDLLELDLAVQDALLPGLMFRLLLQGGGSADARAGAGPPDRI